MSEFNIAKHFYKLGCQDIIEAEGGRISNRTMFDDGIDADFHDKYSHLFDENGKMAERFL